MVGFTPQISIALLLVLSAMTLFQTSICSKHRVVHCNEKDRLTLSIFKQGLRDPLNGLSTWSSDEEGDCCAWKGVQCDNITGRVTKLDLYYFQLEGEINLLSVLQLEFLIYLDLGSNSFENITIPTIHDSVPNPFANFSSHLHHLDLSSNLLDLHMDNLDWLSWLSSLEYLDLYGIDLHKETNWLQIMAMHPSLSELHLSHCQLIDINPSLDYVNFTSLRTLDLSYNQFSSELPHWLFNLTSALSFVDLTGNNLKGPIPKSLLNLRHLKTLLFPGNKLNGSIPDWFGQHEHMQHLDLSFNMFSGSIPSNLGNLSSLIDLQIGSNFLTGNLPYSLGQLSNLRYLEVGNNSLSGVLSGTFFSKLTNLKRLYLTGSNFEFRFDLDWVPPFQLDYLDLSNTRQGPNFPTWIYTQRSLYYLDVSSTGISLSGGDKFWNFVAGMGELYLSNNSITEDISNRTFNGIIYLDHNNFTGRLPNILPDVFIVDVSHNSFSGLLPNGLVNWKSVQYINLGSNKLTGEVPLDLSNLESLKILNLGKNEFFGTIPVIMPKSLEVMILRSDKFVGNIPPQLCNQSSMAVLDLSHNQLMGSIPHCHYNFSSTALDDIYIDNSYEHTYSLVTKGQELQFRHKNQGLLLPTIDFSANNLSEEIPRELLGLIQFHSLNLSYNHLTGKIPVNIGDMKNLESLDLSYNQLFGEIPYSMSALSFLSYLNLSYNNFSGQIPSGNQLQTLDSWSYIGNPELCGAPFTKNCTDEESDDKAKQDAGNGDGNFERDSLYLGMGVGFAVGFWGVCSSLFFIRAWRHMYFQFLNHVSDQIYVAVALKFRSFGGIGASSS